MTDDYNVKVIDNADGKGYGLYSIEVHHTGEAARYDAHPGRCVRFEEDEMKAVCRALIKHFASSMTAAGFFHAITNAMND